MDKNSSVYTFIFAGVLVVVVAFLLASAAIGLKPHQDKNIRIEKMQNILKSVGVIAEVTEAEQLFNQYFEESAQKVLDVNGNVVESSKAFDIDMKKEADKVKKGEGDKQLFPLFVAEKEGETFYVVPMRGNGLWGPVWGYIALKSDLNTVFGATFDHKGETPGLGAEISTDVFQNQFKGEQLFDASGNYVSISVIKGGAAPDNKHGVDGISGGTITSNGVGDMIHKTFKSYMNYFKSKMPSTEAETPVIDTSGVAVDTTNVKI